MKFHRIDYTQVSNTRKLQLDVLEQARRSSHFIPLFSVDNQDGTFTLVVLELTQTDMRFLGGDRGLIQLMLGHHMDLSELQARLIAFERRLANLEQAGQTQAVVAPIPKPAASPATNPKKTLHVNLPDRVAHIGTKHVVLRDSDFDLLVLLAQRRTQGNLATDWALRTQDITGGSVPGAISRLRRALATAYGVRNIGVTILPNSKTVGWFLSPELLEIQLEDK